MWWRWTRPVDLYIAPSVVALLAGRSARPTIARCEAGREVEAVQQMVAPHPPRAVRVHFGGSWVGLIKVPRVEGVYRRTEQLRIAQARATQRLGRTNGDVVVTVASPSLSSDWIAYAMPRVVLGGAGETDALPRRSQLGTLAGQVFSSFETNKPEPHIVGLLDSGQLSWIAKDAQRVLECGNANIGQDVSAAQRELVRQSIAQGIDRSAILLCSINLDAETPLHPSSNRSRTPSGWRRTGNAPIVSLCATTVVTA